MDWNRSQRALIKLAREPFTGCALAVVQLETWGAGLTTALKFMERHPAPGAPRSVVLDGISQWDTVRSLAKKCGRPGIGAGYFNTIHESISRLSQDGKLPVSLWLEEARMMRPAAREMIFAQFAYVAEHCDFDIRVVFIIGKVSVWSNAKQMREPGFPALGNRLVHRAQVISFGKISCEEIEDTDGLEIAREPVANIIKSA